MIQLQIHNYDAVLDGGNIVRFTKKWETQTAMCMAYWCSIVRCHNCHSWTSIKPNFYNTLTLTLPKISLWTTVWWHQHDPSSVFVEILLHLDRRIAMTISCYRA